MVKSKSQLDQGFKLLEEGRNLFNDNKILEAIKKFETAYSFFKKMDAKEQLEPLLALIKKSKEPFLFADEQFRKGLELLESEQNNKLEEAIKLFENVKYVYTSLLGENSFQVGYVEFEIGLCFLKLEKFSEAISRFNDAIKAGYGKDEQNVAACKTNIGYCLFRLGHSSAKKYYEDAIKLYQKFPISIELAEAKVGLGRVLMGSGQNEAAKKEFDEAEEILLELFPEKLGDINVNTGNLLLEQLKFNEAKKYFKKAKSFYRKSKRKVFRDLGVARADLNIGRSYYHLKDDLLAISYSDKAQQVFKKYGYLSEIALASWTRGLAWKSLGDLEAASKEFENCTKYRELIRLQVKSPELRRSFIMEFARVPEEVIAVNLALSDLYHEKKYMEKAFNTLELAKCDTLMEALQTVDNVTPVFSSKIENNLLAEEDRLLNLAAQKYSKYMEIIQLGKSEKFSPKEVRTGTKNWETEYNKIYEEIQDLRHEVVAKCADVGATPLPRNYDVLKEALKVFPSDVNWAVLEFGLLDTFARLVVFLIQKDGLVWGDLSADIDDVHTLVEKCKDVFNKIRMGEDLDEAKTTLEKLSVELYSALIPNNVQKILNNQQIDNLIVIPHKSLHWVPFEILFDGDQYWGLKYSISTAFSLDLLRLCLKKTKDQHSEETPRFLFVKNPLLDLKLADSEVDDILRVDRVKTCIPPLEHEQATQKNVTESLNSELFDVLHYAGHAVFVGKDPSKSSLWLHTNRECLACNKKTNKHSHDLLSAQEIIRDIRFKRSPIIFLSACESGGSEVKEGDEMFGLVRALLYSGATSLILSHWVVRGEIGPAIAKEFYKQLMQGRSVAKALQKARETIHSNSGLDISDLGLFFINGDPFRKIINPKSVK